MNPNNTAARVAGLGYLIIIVCGIFAEFFVRGSLVVPGDAGATAANIAASESFFRLGLAGDLVMLTFDVVVAAMLYVLLSTVNRPLAILATAFRLVHAAVYGLNLLNLMFVLQLVGGGDSVNAFQSEQLNTLVMLFLQGHSYGYVLGLVFFGFHCMVLGYLVYRSGFLPRVLGVMLGIASVGYLVDSFAQVLLPAYAEYATIFQLVVFVPAFLAELSFALWLLIKGVSVRNHLREA